MGWIRLSQGRDRCSTLTNTGMNLQLPWKKGNLWLPLLLSVFQGGLGNVDLLKLWNLTAVVSYNSCTQATYYSTPVSMPYLFHAKSLISRLCYLSYSLCLLTINEPSDPFTVLSKSPTIKTFINSTKGRRVPASSDWKTNYFETQQRQPSS
jgi:hypothetical protein